MTAFRRIYGNFIIKDNPSLSVDDANGASAPSSTLTKENPVTNWPEWTNGVADGSADGDERGKGKGNGPVMINLNQTGGTAYATYTASGVRVTQFRGKGLRNEFSAVEAYPWEGGRGRRCDFWKEVGVFVPQ